MASEPIRDPNKDHLLTPKNCTFLIIDYQPVQVNSIASMERQHLVSNIRARLEGGRALWVAHRSFHREREDRSQQATDQGSPYRAPAPIALSPHPDQLLATRGVPQH